MNQYGIDVIPHFPQLHPMNVINTHTHTKKIKSLIGQKRIQHFLHEYISNLRKRWERERESEKKQGDMRLCCCNVHDQFDANNEWMKSCCLSDSKKIAKNSRDPRAVDWCTQCPFCWTLYRILWFLVWTLDIREQNHTPRTQYRHVISIQHVSLVFFRMFTSFLWT